MYFIKEGFKGIRKHLFVFCASVGVIAACFVLTGSVLLLALNLDYNLENLMEENEFIAYVEMELSSEQAASLATEISAIDNVAGLTYISSEEALGSYVARVGGSSQLYQDLPEDLLPARYSVSVEDIDMLRETAEQVEEMEGISHISMALSVAEGFSATKKTCLSIAAFLLVVLLLVSVFIITNSIRLAMKGREEEIAVMKMVGATNNFVRGPFVVEGTVLGVLSGAAAFGLEYGFYTVIQTIMDSYRFSEMFYVIRFERIKLLILLVYLGCGLLMGIFSSMVAIRRLLKV